MDGSSSQAEDLEPNLSLTGNQYVQCIFQTAIGVTVLAVQSRTGCSCCVRLIGSHLHLQEFKCIKRSDNYI